MGESGAHSSRGSEPELEAYSARVGGFFRYSVLSRDQQRLMHEAVLQKLLDFVGTHSDGDLSWLADYIREQLVQDTRVEDLRKDATLQVCLSREEVTHFVQWLVQWIAGVLNGTDPRKMLPADNVKFGMVHEVGDYNGLIARKPAAKKLPRSAGVYPVCSMPKRECSPDNLRSMQDTYTSERRSAQKPAAKKVPRPTQDKAFISPTAKRKPGDTHVRTKCGLNESDGTTPQKPAAKKLPTRKGDHALKPAAKKLPRSALPLQQVDMDATRSVSLTAAERCIAGTGTSSHNRSRSPCRGRESRASVSHSAAAVDIHDFSRNMARVLRHTASKSGIKLSDDGFAQVSSVLQVLQGCTTGSSLDVLRQTVGESCHRDGEPRFEIREGDPPGPWIRATRNHSIRGVQTTQSPPPRRRCPMRWN